VYPPHLVEKLEARIMRAGPDTVSDRRSWDDDESVASSERRSLDLNATLGGTSGVKADAFAERSTSELLMDSYSDVTVLFSDVVGWTSLSSSMTPEASMQLLDRLWQRYDTLVAAHGVYKARAS
jgi:class 3 adenylate cyclase